jgi:hypothetical protein
MLASLFKFQNMKKMAIWKSVTTAREDLREGGSGMEAHVH